MVPRLFGWYYTVVLTLQSYSSCLFISTVEIWLLFLGGCNVPPFWTDWLYLGWLGSCQLCWRSRKFLTDRVGSICIHDAISSPAIANCWFHVHNRVIHPRAQWIRSYEHIREHSCLYFLRFCHRPISCMCSVLALEEACLLQTNANLPPRLRFGHVLASDLIVLSRTRILLRCYIP